MLSKTGEMLKNELKKLCDDRDFLIAVLTFCKDDIEKQKVLDYIWAGDDVTRQNVLLLALYIKKQRGKTQSG